MAPWLPHVLGLDPGYWQAFWSGIGADIGELAIVGALVATVRRHTCHVHRCWRVGRHPVAGTGHTVCRRHHPDGAPSAADIREAVNSSDRST